MSVTYLLLIVLPHLVRISAEIDGLNILFAIWYFGLFWGHIREWSGLTPGSYLGVSPSSGDQTNIDHKKGKYFNLGPVSPTLTLGLAFFTLNIS